MITAGVDIGGTKTLAALVDADGKILERAEERTDAASATSSVIRALEMLFEKGKAEAIGVGVAAYVTHPEGRVAFAPNLSYDDPKVLDAVRRAFGLPAVVENDASAAAWGEHRFGAGRGATDLMMVTVGTGIGGGIVIDGRLYRGSGGFAAEVGHITIQDEGPRCACGERGCLEALASGTAVARMARESLGAEDSILDEMSGGDGSRITGAVVAEAARARDPLAIRVMERAGRYLGVGVAALVNVLDPDVVVIGGGGADEIIFESARAEVDTRIGPRRPTPALKYATLGNEAGVVGAADLARASLKEREG